MREAVVFLCGFTICWGLLTGGLYFLTANPFGLSDFWIAAIAVWMIGAFILAPLKLAMNEWGYSDQ